MKQKMKVTTVILLNIAFLSTGFICPGFGTNNDNDQLPNSRPADIRFRYTLDGGMLHYGEEIFISEDSCHYEINDGGAKSKVRFSISKPELDKLYDIFLENDFGDIAAYEEKVYDRGGKSISLSWGKGNNARVSNSGMTFIKDSWKNEWATCINAIEKIGLNANEKQKREYRITLGQSLFNKEIHLQVNRDVIIPKSILVNENEMTDHIIKIARLAPGKHRISLSIDKDYENFTIDADSSKSVSLYYNNNTLKIEFEY